MPETKAEQKLKAGVIDPRSTRFRLCDFPIDCEECWQTIPPNTVYYRESKTQYARGIMKVTMKRSICIKCCKKENPELFNPELF